MPRLRLAGLRSSGTNQRNKGTPSHSISAYFATRRQGSCGPAAMHAKFGKSDDSDPTLAWDFLTSKQPVWITGPDAIAANLMSGKPLKILEAIAVTPHGVQSELRRGKLYDQLDVDTLRHDLAVKLVELRTSLKDKNPKLAGGLKVAANSAAFGLLCQMNVKDLDSPCPLHVFSGEASYRTPIAKVWEQLADFY